MNAIVADSMDENLDDRFNKERVRMHRQLYSAISHDLKTPLASMIGALEIYQRMKSRLSEEKQGALIATALQEAHRLDNFLTNILDMGKLENGMVTVRPEPVNIATLLRNCLLNLDNRLMGSEVKILPLSSSADTVEVTTDSGLLCRVMALLLDNTMKYGGKPPVIEISYGVLNATSCMIQVRDHGPGVADEQKEAIFEKYTRFIKRDQQHAGTGLGLAISREILRLLGGTIAVSDAPGGGAVFTLTLPK